MNPAITAEEDQAISVFMSRLAALPLPERSQADIQALWLKGQLLRRWDAERRVQAPLDIVEPLGIILTLAATITLVVWSLPQLLGIL